MVPRVGLGHQSKNRLRSFLLLTTAHGFSRRKTSFRFSSPNVTHAGALLPSHQKIAYACDCFVPRVGLEPTLLTEFDLKSNVYTNFTTRAGATSTMIQD